MPLPILFVLAFATGVGAALADRAELRALPDGSFASRGFWAYTSYATLVLVPTTVYFYLFHGDWSVLYAFNVRRIPSAVALLAFIAELGLGLGGFALCASLLRARRTHVVLAVLAAALAVVVLVVLAGWKRLSVVGTLAQHQRGIALPAQAAAVLEGAIVCGVIMAAGYAYLLWRLGVGPRRE